MSYADPSKIEATAYIAGDIANLVTRLRETRDAARMRSQHGSEALRHSVICDFDFLEHTVASQIEMLCSRLTEAADALASLTRELATAYERAADLAETFRRDGSFDDSMIGAVEHNSNQDNIARAIRNAAPELIRLARIGADRNVDVEDALRQCVGVLEAMRGDFVEPYFNARLKALTHAYSALGMSAQIQPEQTGET